MDIGTRGLWVGLSLLVMALTGCGALGPQVQGSGKLVQEERQASDFERLDVNDGIELTVVVDPAQPRKVRVVGDDNLVALLRTEKAGTDSLFIHFRSEDVGSWSSSNPLRVEVTMPKLEAVTRSGGGTVDVSGSVVSPELFTLEASGGGTVRLRGLDTASFKLDMSGGGDVTVEGHATEVTSKTSGGVELRARELSTQVATLSTSGGGSTEMRVSDSLRVAASGGGEVRIIGRPTVHQEDLSGGATLSFE
ncbi:DUF2807 domain-containing protein [Archangium violaceum]|uniref:head GIN domain-containing protein n=1 Tax=Archangium violaceum TaxID=83451 RepID=UPI00193C641A|nr:head GIN domain-containing protein [Archangium violaceum]QRK07622.1 DUF2807 domain-containing protein [Archangium violaceum]